MSIGGKIKNAVVDQERIEFVSGSIDRRPCIDECGPLIVNQIAVVNVRSSKAAGKVGRKINSLSVPTKRGMTNRIILTVERKWNYISKAAQCPNIGQI